MRHKTIVSLATALTLAPALAAQQPHGHGAPAAAHDEAHGIPRSLRVEHEEIHAQLEEATRAPGAVGEAARAVAKVLHPHFVREEQIALPPLGLLAPLARGEATPEMRAVLPLTDSLRAEMPRMLAEHRAIAAALERLHQVATRAGRAKEAALAEKIRVHALSEEEVTYPAAMLVGDWVRARTKS
ncbi:MAG TPA: hemerythrin domain-containing protein [Gemmatimonadaceae bacterium]|nr:hemerythrin domain-containing protein [Gemmatimonadaceae bacterium]